MVKPVTVSAENELALERPPYGLAGLVALLLLVLYVATIGPTTQFWDTSEYIAAAKVLGIPHPPGNPLFVLLASVWGMLPIAASYALRINLLAATTSALASGFLFLVADRFLRDTMAAPQWVRRATAFAGVFVAATSFTVWNQSTANEKVYTVSLLSIALVLWITVHWGDDTPGPHRDRWLVLIGYLLTLGSTNHMMGVLVTPAVGIYVLGTDLREATRPWVLAMGFAFALAVTGAWSALVDGPAELKFAILAGAVALAVYTAVRDSREFARPMLYIAIGAVAVGISLNYTFLPIRANHFPPINEGEPTNWQSLLAVLNRDQYAKPPLSMRQADFASQLANYWQYFTWQFARDWGAPVRAVLAAVFAGIGLAGAWRQWQRSRRAALAMTALMATFTVFLIYYLNFKNGFSIRPGEDLIREVRERDYFFVGSFLLWGIWVALGFGVLVETTADFFRERFPEPLRWRVASPVLALALIPLFGNRLTAPRAGESLARDFAVDLLQSVEPNAILITAGDNDAFPLWYAQEVEGVRKDVLLPNQSLLNTKWHLRQLQRRAAFPFDSANAADPYRGRSWPDPPTDPPFDLTMEELDALPPYFQITERSIFRVGEVTAVLEAGGLERSDLATLQLMRDNLGKRPIYFSRTTAAYPDRLGLTSFLLGQGLARKLLPHPIEESDTTAMVPGLGWVDIPRTSQLLFDVYHYESAAKDRPRGWIDIPSEGIMALYGVTYLSFSQAPGLGGRDLTGGGDSLSADLAARARDIGTRILNNTSYSRNAARLTTPP